MPRSDRPAEKEVVRTTIVGGRPPGSGQDVGAVPRGLEVLLKKAAVDPAFRQVLLEKRSGAAENIGLQLEPAEALMLAQVPAAQLEGIIARTKVREIDRAAFLGQAAALMLAALGGVSLSGCGEKPPPTTGIRPHGPMPKTEQPAPPTSTETPAPPPKSVGPAVTDGIRPDRPAPKADQPTPPVSVEPPAQPPQPAPTAGTRPTPPQPQLQLQVPPGPTGIKPETLQVSRGVRPDRPATEDREKEFQKLIEETQKALDSGNMEEAKKVLEKAESAMELETRERTAGIRPDRPPVTKGIQPDRPSDKAE